MPKKIKFESFKYRFLIEASACQFTPPINSTLSWTKFLMGLDFSYIDGLIIITWQAPTVGSIEFEIAAKFYLRGDSETASKRQSDDGMLAAEDPIKLNNKDFFHSQVKRLALAAGYNIIESTEIASRLAQERAFHDAWAESEDIENIDVRGSNEVCTAPEMRYITKQLGNLKGKTLLDVGCGLGEASVYFAMQGADVTSSDLSQGMLDATCRLARVNGLSVKAHLASAEDLCLDPSDQFDVIYAGNLLHHVDIESTLKRVTPHLVDGGLLVTWDPLAYNPAINVYRGIATQVRTPDEHPLTWSDIKLFRRYFSSVKTRYFWFTTLIIFVIMALAQRRDPNKERFWKVILKEGPKWAWLYRPLEVFDQLLMAFLPPLRLLCWNVVIVCKK